MNLKLVKVNVVFIAGLFGAASAQAAIDISQVPLQTGSAIPPNVMFLIDDSGSMHWEVTPDRLRGSSNRPSLMYPLTDGIYGGSDSPDKVPSFRFSSSETSNDNERITAAYYRTPSINTSYYDPAVTYQPWVKADGSLYPNAVPSAAYHHPYRTGKGTRNLTASNTQSTAWVTCTGVNGSGCSETTQSRSFYPAVYFRYNGNGFWNKNNYTRVEIRSTTALYVGDGRNTRTDCSAAATATCTYAEEIQNFANWYTYYRSRLLSAQAAIGIAFVNQSEKMRVGFGALNQGNNTVDGVSTKTIINGVRPFSGSDRSNFYQKLYERTYAYNGTPLREALQRAGEYFSRTDDKGPWSLTPGFNSPTEDQIECRQSFTILMTDGVWSSGSVSNIDNEDNTAGQSISKPNGDEFTYQPVAPFSDAYSETLADVAMYYWKRDLRPDLENRVPVSTINPAFWQHMVTFGVGFGVDGSIDPDTAFNAINSRSSIPWPNPTSSDAAKTDDLLHASVNGRGGFFTADNPKLFGEKLARTLNQIVERVASASNLAGTTTSLQADKFVYQGSFNSGNWSGGLVGFNIDDVSTPVWSANFPQWDSRNIIFGKTNGGAEVFNPVNVAADNNALSAKPLIVDYIRGSRALEPTGGSLLARASLLGDIANSSPAYSAGPVRRPYSRYSFDGASSFLSHAANNANRTPLIFVGANDGMLHAFNANTGLEKFAYIPKQVLTAEANLASYADPNYEHRYFVDGSPVVADVYDGSSWKTIVIGTMGRGGNSMFALDVNQPDSFSKTNVLWDKTFAKLGTIVTKPVVSRLNNGRWAVVVGYGYNNSTNKAGLLVIDALTGDVLKDIDTPAGYNSGDNGSSQVEGWDANSDGNTDWFFSGDLLGNVWKYDLSSSNPSDWKIAYTNKPLFTAKDTLGNKQKITGGISLATDTTTGKLWVFFGTGSMLTDEDPLLNNTESWYGIQDGVEVSSRSELKERTLTNISYSGQIDAREVSASEPNDMNGKKGWYIDLIDDRERMVSPPVFVGTTLLANSVIPGNSDCNPEGDGWVMAIDPFKGSRLDVHFFDFNGDKKFNTDDGITSNDTVVPASGLKFDSMTNSPLIFEDQSDEGSIMITGETGLGINADYVNTGVRRGRVSWRELTN